VFPVPECHALGREAVCQDALRRACRLCHGRQASPAAGLPAPACHGTACAKQWHTLDTPAVKQGHPRAISITLLVLISKDWERIAEPALGILYIVGGGSKLKNLPVPLPQLSFLRRRGHYSNGSCIIIYQNLCG